MSIHPYVCLSVIVSSTYLASRTQKTSTLTLCVCVCVCVCVFIAVELVSVSCDDRKISSYFTILLDECLLSCQFTFNIGIIQGQGEAGCYGYK